LRIDVDRADAGRPYAIPADNPFRDRPDALPEIWAYGFREPWRFSFDPTPASCGSRRWAGSSRRMSIVRRGENLAVVGSKTEPPRFTKAIGPNLRQRIRPIPKWIVGRDCVRPSGVCAIDINAQHFSKGRRQILPVTLWSR